MMFGWFEMALEDQDLTQPATASSFRVKDFLSGADSIRLDDQLQAMAAVALESDKAFERFAWQLLDLVPQLDRVCVTSVENDKLRLKLLHERPGLRTSLRSRSTVIRASGQSLAAYALGSETVVNQDLSGAAGSVMANMARKDIRSSMHVPVEIGGVRSTVNFWSAEAGAFPPEAVRLLEEAAHRMAQPARVAQQQRRLRHGSAAGRLRGRSAHCRLRGSTAVCPLRRSGRRAGTARCRGPPKW